MLGARTNCEGLASSGAAGLVARQDHPAGATTGTKKNRPGTHLVDVRTRVDSFLDRGLLGYFAGQVAGEEAPGRHRQPGAARLG